jgi:ABC-type nitrate/sulfonate/bicarbonate transport system substrate-binding protein
VILLSGCKETKSEAWYKQHPDETYAVYTQCLKDGEASDNCEFAHRAALMFAQEGQPGVKENSRRYFSRKLQNEMQ